MGKFKFYGKYGIGLIAVLLLFSYCDNVTKPVANKKIQFIPRPINYIGNTANYSVAMKKKQQSSPYYCLYSTLNPAGTKYAYHYEAFDIKVPKGLVKKARKDGNPDDQWVTIKLGSHQAVGRKNADIVRTDKSGKIALVRMVRCKVPSSPKVIRKVKKRIRKFDKKKLGSEK